MELVGCRWTGWFLRDTLWTDGGWLCFDETLTTTIRAIT